MGGMGWNQFFFLDKGFSKLDFFSPWISAIRLSFPIRLKVFFLVGPSSKWRLFNSLILRFDACTEASKTSPIYIPVNQHSHGKSTHFDGIYSIYQETWGIFHSYVSLADGSYLQCVGWSDHFGRWSSEFLQFFVLQRHRSVDFCLAFFCRFGWICVKHNSS